MSTLDNKKYFFNKLKKILLTFFSFLLAIVLIVIAFKGIDFKETLSFIVKANLFYVLLYIILLFLAHYFRAVRWKLLLYNVKKDVESGNLFGGLMIGYALNSALPRAGELARAAVVVNKEKISLSSTLGSIFLDRVLDIFFLAIALFISLIFYSKSLYDKIIWLKDSLLYLFLLLAFCLAVIYLFIFQKNFLQKISNFLFSKISPKLEEKLANFINRLMDGAYSIRNRKNFFSIISLSFLIYLFYALCAFIGFYLVDLNKENWAFMDGWIVMTITSFGNLVPTPGAIGSYHLIAVSLLKNLYGIEANLAMVYALLTHFLSYASSAFVGFIFYFAWGGHNLFKLENKKASQP